MLRKLNRPDFLFVFFVALCPLLICLSPILIAGLYSDDLPNYIQMSLGSTPDYKALFSEINSSIIHWKKFGRYNPFAFLFLRSFFFFYTSINAIKCCILVLNLMAVSSFILLLKNVNNRFPLFVFPFIYVSMIQFRVNFFDAYSSLNGMYPFFCFLLFLSLNLFLYYLKNRKTVFFVFSFLLFCCCLLFIEVAVVALPIYIVFLYRSTLKIKEKVLVFFPYFAFFSWYICYFFYLKSLIQDPSAIYQGMAMNLSIKSVLPAFAKQIFSTLPLSFFYNETIFLKITNWISSPVLISLSAILILSVFFAFNLIRKSPSSSLINPFLSKTDLIFISFLLIIVPGGIISLTVKYQQILFLGKGYLPVYIQHFGLSILLMLLFEYLLEKRMQLLAKGLLLIFVAISILTLWQNTYLAKRYMSEITHPTIATFQSFKAGILDSVPNQINLFISNDYFYTGKYLYEYMLREKLNRDMYVKFAEKLDTQKISYNSCYLDCKPQNNGKITLYYFSEEKIKKRVYQASQYNDFSLNKVRQE